MKFSNVIVALLLWLTGSSQKDSSGVYMSADDFSKGKLTYVINCRWEKHKIKAHDFFQRPCFEVIHHDSIYKMNKKDVFGVRLCTNETFRFYDDKEFPVLNPNEPILIYRVLLATPAKTYPKPNEYFFSKNVYSAPQHLTIDNLKAAFSNNRNFVELIDDYFSSDDQLPQYDRHLKMYQINILYKRSLETQSR